jgi:hypothetical protein
MMHALSCTIVHEFYHGELALCPRLDVLDGSHCTILGRNRGYPHVPAEIIHKQQKVLVTP